MDIQIVLLYLGLGLLFQLLSIFFPFRTIEGRKEFGWDISSMLAGKVVSVVFWLAIGNTIIIAANQQSLIQALQASVEQWSFCSLFLVQLLLTDFLLYWAHRLLHTQLLWHSHAWHHSPKHMWWLAGLRAAPLHVVVLSLPFALTYIAFPTPEGDAVAITLAVFRIANQHWLHSNIKLPYSRALELLFITPRAHFVHHDQRRCFSDSNYGFIFSFWDRLFGTYTQPQTVGNSPKLGLNYHNTPMRLFLGLPPPKTAQPSSQSLSQNTPQAE